MGNEVRNAAELKPAPVDSELPRVAWLCETVTLPEAWLDHMGHVNIQYYFAMAARAVFHAMDRRLRPGAEDAPPRTVYTLEASMRYQAELLAGQRVRVWFRPLSRTEKIVRALITIERLPGEGESGAGAAISAECEWTGCYADEATRRVAPLPEEARGALDRKLEEAAGAPAYQPPRFNLGRELDPAPEPVVADEGEVPAEWIDRHDHVGIQHYTLIVFRANVGFMRKLGFDLPAMAQRRWGAFALSTSLKYTREMRQGERYQVLTRVTHVARKTFTLRHDIVDPGETGKVYATAEHVMAFADMATRRTRAIPEEFLEKVTSRG